MGGNQPAEQWLSRRRGRQLSAENLEHYLRIEAAIRQTIELQRDIDAAIDAAGGWPLGWLARGSNLRLLSSCEP